MLKDTISITGFSSISALGDSANEVLEKYQNGTHSFSFSQIGEAPAWVGELAESKKKAVERLRHSDSKYRNLDNSVLYAIHAARKAVEMAGWEKDNEFGINMGSSRGATELFEKHHKDFLDSGKSSPLSSPTTTLGNISSWVAHDLNTKGPAISHSITCSTALHALLNGVAWLQSGLRKRFLVGGSEAPLTPFTVAQMQALKLYSEANKNTEYPCKAMDLKKTRNTMVLGEAAAIACLELGAVKNALGTIKGIGYATEPLNHNVSISTEAKCFQDSMRMALGNIPTEAIDSIIMHAPGTVKGDLAEFEAVRKVFPKRLPFLTNNKWKLGHTFGASGLLSLELAFIMLREQEYFKNPFMEQEPPSQIRNILINAVGFGGNAVSILISK